MSSSRLDTMCYRVTRFGQPMALGFVFIALVHLSGCAADPACRCPMGTICDPSGQCVFPAGDGGATEGGPMTDIPSVGSNQALVCDGVDDEVRISLAALLPLTSFTLEVWVKVDGHLPLGSPPQPLVYAPSSDFFDTFSLRLADWPLTKDRRLRFSAQKRLARCDGPAQSASPGARTLEPGSWHHVAALVEIDSKQKISQSFFVDGKRETGGTVHWISGEFPCHELEQLVVCGIAHPFDTISPFVGAIDALRLSMGARYTADFTPADPKVDATTILYLGFDALPLSIQGLAADKAQLLSSGDPQLVATP